MGLVRQMQMCARNFFGVITRLHMNDSTIIIAAKYINMQEPHYVSEQNFLYVLLFSIPYKAHVGGLV